MVSHHAFDKRVLSNVLDVADETILKDAVRTGKFKKKHLLDSIYCIADWESFVLEP